MPHNKFYHLRYRAFCANAPRNHRGSVRQGDRSSVCDGHRLHNQNARPLRRKQNEAFRAELQPTPARVNKRPAPTTISTSCTANSRRNGITLSSREPKSKCCFAARPKDFRPHAGRAGMPGRIERPSASRDALPPRSPPAHSNLPPRLPSIQPLEPAPLKMCRRVLPGRGLHSAGFSPIQL